ncbi:MAG: hypothetical protein KGL39_38540 [Patescibacteria group bacterium]|nr:hypothetical protein [Patescibacteria group bacterium]
MISATTEALDRAMKASMDAATRQPHPAIAVPLATRAGMGELIGWLRERASTTRDIEDVRYDLDELAEELEL